MIKVKNIVKKYFSPIFWVSFIALISIILLYNYYGLPLRRARDTYIFLILVYGVIGFFGMAFNYQIIFKTNKWSSIKQLLGLSAKLTFEFFIKAIPFFIFLYIYDSIHDITHLINSYEFDYFLVVIDRFMLLGNDIALLFEKIIHPKLTDLMAWSYNLYFVFFLVDPMIYFLVKGKKVFDTVLTSVIIACYLGLVGYILVPCLGPILYQQDLFNKDLVLSNCQPYIQSDDLSSAYTFSRGYFHCFPSLHFGITFVWLFLAWKYLRKERFFKYFYYLHIPLVLLLWMATLYLRWHYLIDWVGGLLVAVLGIWLGKKIVDKWYKYLKK